MVVDFTSTFTSIFYTIKGVILTICGVYVYVVMLSFECVCVWVVVKGSTRDGCSEDLLNWSIFVI